MQPEQVTTIQLQQIASAQQDAIVFDVSSIPSLANEQEIYLIFYLSKEDEASGYGTVIQLDPQTKQAAIYADLNPEYTYLFYADKQNQLASLLWCIEVATRTQDGLFIAHAKSYGRGVSEAELQQYTAQNQPQAARPLAEAYTPQTNPSATESASSSSAPSPDSPAQPGSQPQADVSAQNNPAAPSQPSQSNANLTSFDQLTAQAQPAVNPAPSMQTEIPPAPSMTFDQNNPSATTPTNLPTNQPTDQASSWDTAPQSNTPEPPTNQPPAFNPDSPTPTPGPADPAEAESPAPAQPQSSTPSLQASNPNSQTDSPAMSSPDASPAPIMDIPDIFSPRPSLSSVAQPTPKQPVGRPQKQLKADQLWTVSQQDFSWAKAMSRSTMDEIKDELWQKVIKQIRANRPGLIEDWEFHGAFEEAFHALAMTYDLLPALRHDILKALLNGRVAENVAKQKHQHKFYSS